MFPSKFLQFPSILTHFHAANEKIQNGGRDLAISHGLVWVKNSYESSTNVTELSLSTYQHKKNETYHVELMYP